MGKPDLFISQAAAIEHLFKVLQVFGESHLLTNQFGMQSSNLICTGKRYRDITVLRMAGGNASEHEQLQTASLRAGNSGYRYSLGANHGFHIFLKVFVEHLSKLLAIVPLCSQPYQ